MDKTKADLKTALSRGMMLEQRVEKSAVFLLMSEKTHGLKNKDKQRVVDMFKDKKFNEVKSNIDDIINVIKEGDIRKRPVTEAKRPDTKIVTDDDITTPKVKIVENKTPTPIKKDMAFEANSFLTS